MPTRELLSLFPIFDAIFAEESLSRAAERLGVSQSAISQSLARLRQLTSDELFQSTGRGMRPTPRAIMMIRHVRAALAEADAVAVPRAIDLATLDRTFVVDMGAGLDAILLPVIVREFVNEAPRAKLKIASYRSTDPANALRTGEIELAFDFMAPSVEGIKSQQVRNSPPLVISRKGHPQLQAGLSEAMYQSLGHVALNWNRSVAPSANALEMKRQGREINNVITVPSMYGVGAVVASSDLIATVPDRLAHELAKRFELNLHRVPFPIAAMQLHLLWHMRSDGDPAHQWLRATIERLVGAQEQDQRPAPLNARA